MTTTKAEQIRAKTARLKAAQSVSTEEKPEVKPSRAVKPRVTPVRRTVDLSPAHHAQLTEWCGETARMIGSARVTGQDVLRTLVARLLTDETLARKIRHDLRESQ